MICLPPCQNPNVTSSFTLACLVGAAELGGRGELLHEEERVADARMRPHHEMDYLQGVD